MIGRHDQRVSQLVVMPNRTATSQPSHHWDRLKARIGLYLGPVSESSPDSKSGSSRHKCARKPVPGPADTISSRASSSAMFAGPSAGSMGKHKANHFFAEPPSRARARFTPDRSEVRNLDHPHAATMRRRYASRPNGTGHSQLAALAAIIPHSTE